MVKEVEATPPPSLWRWPATWLAFVAFHATCMMVDWQLRDPASPMAGGIPDLILALLQGGSVGLLFIGLSFFMPRSWALWLRLVLAALQSLVAFVLMVVGWLYYVVGSGIDTL